MKKYLALLICIATFFGNTVFAEDLYLDESTSSSTLIYHIDSSFCVVIPETLDAFNGFELSAYYMNITESEQVNVYINGENSITMSNESGDTFNMRLNLNDHNRVAEFIKNQLTSGWVTYGSMFDDAAMPAAGEYTGTVNFIVRLEPIGYN